MKKLLLICLMLSTCTAIIDAQKIQSVAKSPRQRLQQAWADLRKSKDSTAMLITQVKELASKKVVYRTKLLIQHDTAWRVDTCVQFYKPIDSATIAIMYKQPDIQKQIKVGKRVQIIILKRKTRENKK